MGDKETQALIEELRASREQNAATVAILVGIVEGLKPKPEADLETAMAERLAQFRGKPSVKLVTVHERCTSPDTGATFDVEIQNGEVARFRNYTIPANAMLPLSQGGFWGGEIYEHGQIGRDGKPKLILSFQQELYNRFLKADSLRYVGKPCPKYLSDTSAPAPKSEAAPIVKTG